MVSLAVLFCVMFCLSSVPATVGAQTAEKEKTAEPEQKEAKQKVEPKEDSSKDAKQLAKEADIRKLLVATGAGKMGIQVMQQMFNSLKMQNPNIPSDYFEKLMKEVDANELIEITIPSYDKHLTHDEVKQLIKFYESPIGKKLVEKQPFIMQDAMVAGQKWGFELNRRLQEKIEEDF